MANNCWAKALILTAAATAVSAQYHCISALSAPSKEGPEKLDIQIFGTLPNGSIWSDAHGFGRPKWSGIFNVSASTRECPSVVSEGKHGASMFYISINGSNVIYEHSPEEDKSGKKSTNLTAYNIGGNVSAINTLNFEEDGLVLVAGLTLNKTYILNGVFQNDPTTASRWGQLGGNFTSKPALAKQIGDTGIWVWGIDANGTLRYKPVRGTADEVGLWRKLGGGPFQGNPVVTSREDGTLDLWTIDAKRALNHRVIGAKKPDAMFMAPDNEWHNLGGSFNDTPAVIYRGEDKFYVVGKGQTDQKHYAKRFDGREWFPAETKWLEVGGPFVSEPAILAEPLEHQLYMFAIDKKDEIQLLAWHDGMDTAYEMETLGKLPPHNHTVKSTVLGSLEL